MTSARSRLLPWALILIALPAQADGLLNVTDLKALLSARSADSALFDINGNGIIEQEEFLALGRSYGAIASGLIGDTDAGSGFYFASLDDTLIAPLATITVTWDTSAVASGGLITVTQAYATYTNGDTLDIRNYLRLGASDTTLLQPSGKTARSTGVGSAQLYATFGGISGSTTTVTVPPAARFNLNSPLGSNLIDLTYYTTDYPFVDCFKASSAWDIVGGGTLDLDADGWVRSLDVGAGQGVRTRIFASLAGNYPAGRYIMLYEGTGTIGYAGSAQYRPALSSPGRDVIDVDPALGDITINITATTPGNYLRNMRLIMPGGVSPNDPYRWCASETDCPGGGYVAFETNYATQIFHPHFLDRLKTYRAIRLIGWARISGSPVSSWNERPRISNARWTTETGVPLEIMCSLANRIQADPWFVIPHLATDDFVTQYASLVRDSLAKNLRSYVEHSNEVWNPIFAQNAYIQSRGLALGLSADTTIAGRYYHARRSGEIFNIWKSVHGGSTDSFYRVIAAQAASATGAQQILDFENTYLNADLLAIGPYFGVYLGSANEETRVQAMTLNQLFTELEDTALPGARTQMQAHAAVAASHNLGLAAYEGGQHLARQGLPANDTINALFEAANRDARMGTLYTTYLNDWRTAGGRLFNHFVNCNVFNPVGRWGALEYPTQPRSAAPKFDALQKFIEFNPKWW
ncbi:MAG: hypothetical protein AAB229_08510 [Candidatus Hydrogenedentota bacterium]